MNENITVCDKCEEWFPTIVFTCPQCCQEVARARGYKSNTHTYSLCLNCYQELTETAWKYKELNK